MILRIGRDRDHLEADQQEQDRVQQLVDQRPEFEQIVARRLAHRQRDPGIADQQARDRHRHRPADVKPAGEAVAAHHDRERDHHLDIIFVDAAHRPEPDPADRKAEQNTAAGLDEEGLRGMTGRKGLGPDRRRQYDREHDDADAVVEQALAGDGRLERRRDRRALQHAHDRHRIGRADQRAEHEAPQKRDAKPERARQRVEPAADDQGRKQHADRAQNQDRPAPAPHLVPVDMERAGEQQEGQHAVHQRRVEVDPGKKARDALRQIARREQMIDADHQQRGDRAHDREPDGGGQAEQAMVEIAERGGQHDQDRCCVERAEGGGGHVGFLRGSEVLMPVLFGCRNRAGLEWSGFCRLSGIETLISGHDRRRAECRDPGRGSRALRFRTGSARSRRVARAARLPAGGLVGPREALLGFADPAVIAVAAVLVVGRAVELTGIAGAVTRTLVPARAGFAMQLAMLMLVAAFLSAFMNNIAALVITMPLAAETARRAKLPPAATLMPLAFSTILGGMTTLIGTPANLILSSVREEELGTPFGFFSMTGVGAAVAAVGLVYLALVGWRLIPLRPGNDRVSRPWRVFELDAPVSTASPPLLPALRKAGARLLGRFRGVVRLAPDQPAEPGDRLLLLSRNSQWDVAEQAGLAPNEAMRSVPGAVTARVVVAHGSFLIGEGYEAVRTRSGGRVAIVAGGPRAARLGEPLDTIRMEAGDQLYIRGVPGDVAAFLTRARMLEVDRFDPAPLDPWRGGLTVGIFAAAVAAAVSGIATPAIAFLAAAGAVAALRLIPADESTSRSTGRWSCFSPR